MDTLQLRQRIVRSMIRVNERTQSMRKPDKFVYREILKASYLNMLRYCVDANRSYGNRRRSLQDKMDSELDMLRTFVDVAALPEEKLISPGLHEVWSKELNEIGRMLGGWIKSNE